MLAAEEGALEVDSDDAVEELLGHLRRRGDRLLDAGVVEDGMQPAVLAFGGRDESRDLGLDRDIGAQEGRLAASAPNLLAGRLATALVDVAEDDARPLPRGEGRGRAAHPGRRAGHDGDLAVQCAHRAVLTGSPELTKILRVCQPERQCEDMHGECRPEVAALLCTPSVPGSLA